MQVPTLAFSELSSAASALIANERSLARRIACLVYGLTADEQICPKTQQPSAQETLAHKAPPI